MFIETSAEATYNVKQLFRAIAGVLPGIVKKYATVNVSSFYRIAKRIDDIRTKRRSRVIVVLSGKNQSGKQEVRVCSLALLPHLNAFSKYE
ncbi:unnamed protein product [Heligmosomoides polygyrus]|uniref:DDE_Tnp_ISL3 domain-containing protein n=1 Tax=Heligmosomoides polygyrus TaxID=6339 RepID=A0A3P7YWZ0_HELPZ|nr:unnamed protein product [Heligmosomoides polygyrus]